MRRPRRRIVAALLITSALWGGCARTTGDTFRPVLAPDSETAYRELVRIRESFPGVQSYARMRASAGERRQSFNARLALDRSGRARIDGLTPLGTAAITIWTDGQQVVFLDHLSSIYWRGPASELSGSLRVIAQSGALLLAGLPATDPSAVHRTSSSGLAEAEISGVRFTYEPPSFPPQRVVIESGTDRLEVEHADFRAGSGDLAEPRIDPSYRRGRAPSLLPPAGG